MGFLRSRLEERASPEDPNTPLSNPAQWLIDWAGGAPTKAGERVNETTAMRFTTVWACIRVLAETVAQLPVDVYERKAGMKRVVTRQHPVSDLIRNRPNGISTGFVFRETVQGHAASWGNGYAEIIRRRDTIEELVPLLPSSTRPVLDAGTVWFIDSSLPAKPRAIPGRDVFHVPAFGFDGLQGYSPIQTHRETIGYGLAVRDFGATWFGKGTKPAGVLSVPGKIKDGVAEEVARRFQFQHGGANAHNVAVVGQGGTWTQVGLPPNDSQFIETQELLVTEIARIFLMKPHKIGFLRDAGDRANMEQENTGFLTDTMLPWLKRWEAEYNRKLFTPAERERFFVEFNVDGLMRGDLAARQVFYTAMRNAGVYTVNDILRRENQNPISKAEGGDVRLVPMNMVPLDQVVDGPPALPAVPPATRELQNRAVQLRRRIQRTFTPLLAGAGGRIVTKETGQVLRAVKRLLKTRDSADLAAWLEAYYQDYGEVAARQLLPVLLAYGEQMGQAAADEVNADAAADLEQFSRRYATAAGARYTSSHLGQLQALIVDTPADQLQAVLEGRLLEWQDTAPAKLANREAVQAGSAFTKAVWAGAGVTALRWLTFSPCPICAELDGRIVSITANFMEPGDVVEPGGGVSPLRVRELHGHPPLHQGCECAIGPA